MLLDKRRTKRTCAASRPCVVAICLAAWLLPSRSPADVIVIANRVEQTVEYRVVTHGRQPRKTSLAAGETRTLATSGSVELLYDVGGKLARYRLDANAAYYFTRQDTGWLDLRKIDLGGDRRTFSGRVVGDGQQEATIGKIPVKILVDNHEPTTRRVWESRLRKRIALVSDVLERTCRLRLEVVAVSQWTSGDEVANIDQGLREFQRKVDPRPGWLAIGFTGKYRQETGPVHLGGARGLLRPHILVREWSVSTGEAERMELLLHEVGHYLGAVHSPDSDSVMRPKLADNKAIYRKFRVQFDPVNTLIVNLVAEDIRATRAHTVGKLSAGTRLRLSQIYAALAKAMPNDNSARQFQFQLAMVADTPLAIATRRVVQEVGRAAAARSDPTEPERGKLRQDQLTNYYVRQAADLAGSVPPEVAPSAFLLGLGVALDDSGTLQQSVLTREFCQAVDTSAERLQRLRALGQPTVFGRRDLAQHFFLSAYLTVALGPQAAESAGLVKELMDARTGSGFSYADLAADLAGIAFANRVLSGAMPLKQLGEHFAVAEHVPSIEGLPEGVGWDELSTQLAAKGSGSLAAYRQTILERIRRLQPAPKSPLP